MPTVAILPDHVANQIAAGEVIERPVAVVKELVENSLDAGAGRIEVEFRRGGTSYIRVEDNGSGMSQEDALLALERHATSKLRHADDLLSVQSFGFRGEALPSIASISRFTLRSRQAGADVGTEISINAGKILHVRDCGMPTGTSIEVAQLFNSVPARRKFLKTENTEAAHITHTLRMLAVANPSVAFRVVEDGRTLFNTPACPDIRARVLEIFGHQRHNALMELEAEVDGMQLTGLIGKPGIARSSRHEMASFVNRRPVDSRTINYALIEAYHAYLARGKYPMAFLLLEIDPAAIDVNIHPAKREVRFRQEAKVRQFIITTLLDRLQAATNELKATHTPAPKPDLTERGIAANMAAKQPIPKPSHLPERPVESAERPVQPAERPVQPAERPVQPAERPVQPAERSVQSPKGAIQSRRWRCIGLAHGAYAIFETSQGVVLLNRRGAQGRILLESILNRDAAQPIASQRLLFPLNLETDAIAAAAYEEHGDFFLEEGFQIEPFGRQFFRVLAVPAWLDLAEAETFLEGLTDRLQQRQIEPGKARSGREALAQYAAQQAVRLEPNPPLSQLETIAERLLQCRNPLVDAKGRPTLIELSREELGRKFGG